MSITVKVTRADIKAGVKNHALKCPVSRALARALGKRAVRIIWPCAAYRLVFGARPFFQTSKGGSYYPLPETVGRFVQRFDAGKSVKPFSFKGVRP